MAECIPPLIRKQCENAYFDYDKPLFIKEQTEISKMFLTLRETF